MTETLPEPTMHMKLQNRAAMMGNPHPPSMPKPNAKLRIDPQRALEPARKKLSTVEAQRIMAVLCDSIRRTELLTALPYVLENIDRFSTMLGADLTSNLKEHNVLMSSFNELKDKARELMEQEQAKAAETAEVNETGSTRGSNQSRASSVASGQPSQAEETIRNLNLVARQIQYSCKSILRAFSLNPAVLTSILKDHGKERSKESQEMIGELNELKEIVMNMLLTTPVEEQERKQYLMEISQRERYNAGIIEKLEVELNAAIDDKECEIRKKNDVIRRLQADLHQIEKFSDEHIRRTKSEAEKQEAADLKNSEGKRTKLTQEVSQLKTQLQNLVAEHRENEQALRKKKFKMETEVENWIQKYDRDMGERQTEYEEIDLIYTEEKKQLTELEERFKTLEEEYTAIMEERRIAREKQEEAERELQMCVKAATTIQAFWRSYKVRKALKGKKKKKGGKKGKK